jgi:hypothetical protein
LGERLLCKQEVDGSIPFTSTRLRSQEAGSRKESDREKQSLLAASLLAFDL